MKSIVLVSTLAAFACDRADPSNDEPTRPTPLRNGPATPAPPAPAAVEPAPQAVSITVTKDGYQPERVHVEKGRPTKLVITRTSDETCARELVLAAHDIKKDLPLNQPVEIVFTPTKSGDLTYACGMNMETGVIAVR